MFHLQIRPERPEGEQDSELVIDVEVRHRRSGELARDGDSRGSPGLRGLVEGDRRERSRHESGDGQYGDQGSQSLDRAALEPSLAFAAGRFGGALRSRRATLATR